jgi:TolB-like protein/class 3 adenylate cyclase
MAQKRQLAAILFADVQGFTALVQQDEDRAKVIKDKFHKVLETGFKTHHGRIVYFQGDGVCCIFRSAVDAVIAAVEVQLKMLQEPKVPLRIGIHLGDVIVEGKDIFGDGVNIASRVESFALPGGVFITDVVYHEIRNHTDIRAISLGKYEFKNVKESIEIYAISNSGLTIPLQKKLTGKGKAVTDKKYWYMISAAILILATAIVSYFNFFKNSVHDKSIAVIPFINVSDNPAEEYLSDGFTEDILTSLSNIADFKVTSFASTRQYKGTTKTIKQIAGELNVAYILEGSVQRFGDQLRITAQLINAKDDAHVWAKNYDESFREILAIQSKVSREIAFALQTKLSPDEKKRIAKHPTLNADAYQLYLKGRYYWNLRTRENLDTSIQFFLKAIKLDPDYALAYSGIADAYTVLGDNGFLPVDSVSAKARSALDKALVLDSSLAEVRASYAIYLGSMEGNGTAAIRELERITRFNPNYASAFQWYAIELSAKGQFETAKEMIEKAVVLDPRSKRIYENKALIYLYAKDINKAISVLKQAPEGFSSDLSYVVFLAKLFYLKGVKDSAQYYARLCNDEILLAIFKNDKASFKKILKDRTGESRISAEEIATFYTMAGEKDSAFIWLKRSVNNKEYGSLKFLAVSPYWDPLRNDSRFALLLQNSGIR